MRFHGLDLNLLVVLDVLLAEQNITRAGNRLHLSQPATSAALSRLREYFADDLLVQVGRRMVRTPLGESLAQPVRDLLIQMRSTLQNRAQFKPEEAERTFSFMVSDYVGTVLMPHVSKRVNELAPGCAIEQFSPSDDAALEIERGHVDFLLLPEQHIIAAHPSTALFSDEYVCVICNDHPLASATLTLDDYRDLPHVLVRWGDRHRAATVDDWFLRRFEFQRRAAVTTNTFSSVPLFLIGTERIATMHRRLAERWVNYLPLQIVPLPWQAPPLSIAMQWNRYQQHDPGLTWLRNMVVQTATELGA